MKEIAVQVGSRSAEKTCSACRQTKPLGSFQRRRGAPDGLRGVCRDCRQAKHREWIASQDPERIREYGRRFSARHPERVAAHVREWRKANPERRRAQTQRARSGEGRRKWLARASLYKAVKAGRITRPAACERCGQACKPDAHHDDYSRPLDVRWLCRPCHNEVDAPKRRAADTKMPLTVYAEKENRTGRREARPVRARMLGEVITPTEIHSELEHRTSGNGQDHRIQGDDHGVRAVHHGLQSVPRGVEIEGREGARGSAVVGRAARDGDGQGADAGQLADAGSGHRAADSLSERSALVEQLRTPLSTFFHKEGE